jgi:hypothetical protein
MYRLRKNCSSFSTCTPNGGGSGKMDDHNEEGRGVGGGGKE